MKKLILISIFIALPVWAEPVSSPLEIHDDLNKHAINVLEGKDKNYSQTQKELSNTVSDLDVIAGEEKELKKEIKTLKQTLSEIEKINLLRTALRKELKSEPTGEEVMKLYFELKATEDIKQISE